MRTEAEHLQIILLLHPPQDNSVRERSWNDIGIFLTITEVHGIAFVCSKKHCLSSFREAAIIQNIREGQTAEPAGVDEDFRFWEHIVQLLEGLDSLANKPSSQFRDLLAKIWHMSGGVRDQSLIGPSTIEVVREFTTVQLPKLRMLVSRG